MTCAKAFLFLSLSPLAWAASGPSLVLPQFPAPALVQDEFGQTKVIGFLKFYRELEKGGVQGLDQAEFGDNDYAVLRSDSLSAMAAWLETTCRAVGLDLPKARDGRYDGAVYARLLEVAASLAELRGKGEPLAIPVGVVVCNRQSAWGDLPGDGERDAYVIVETERGLLVYDPPTRQLSELDNFPNLSGIVMVQF